MSSYQIHFLQAMPSVFKGRKAGASAFLQLCAQAAHPLARTGVANASVQVFPFRTCSVQKPCGFVARAAASIARREVKKELGRLLPLGALVAWMGLGEGTFPKEKQEEFGVNGGMKAALGRTCGCLPVSLSWARPETALSVPVGGKGNQLYFGLFLVAGASSLRGCGRRERCRAPRAGEGGGLGWSPPSAESQAGPGGFQ